MQMQTFKARRFTRGLLASVAIVGLLALAGCATHRPYYGNNNAGYGTNYGTVQSVRQVYVRDGDDSHVLGTIIGAVAGGLLGNTVGQGDGRKAATVVGAVAGGVVGHKVAEHNDQGGSVAWRVVVRLDDGRMATVTQRDPPRVSRGDRVQIRGDHVYML